MTGVSLVLMMTKMILLFISLLSLVTSSLLLPRRGGALGQFWKYLYIIIICSIDLPGSIFHYEGRCVAQDVISIVVLKTLPGSTLPNWV